jgi:ferric-dicitrate binding protein FerR (iron transport regulator)
VHFTSLKKLISRYLIRKTSAEENTILEKWLDSIKDGAEVGQTIGQPEKDEIRGRLLQKIKAKAYVEPKVVLFQPWMKMAAAIIPLALTIATLFLYTQRIKTIQVHTAFGEYKEVMLPDSSFIRLYPNSSIEFPSHFGETRKVNLSGQAFFDVKRNPDKPFNVQTSELGVEVLGTSFEVQAYDQWQQATVSVVTGKVKVYTQAQTLATLVPKHKLTYQLKQNTFDVNTENQFHFDKTAIVFENTPLTTVLLTLQNFYPVTIKHTEIDKAINLSGSFNRDMSIDQIVSAINSILENHQLTIQKTNEYEYQLK